MNHGHQDPWLEELRALHQPKKSVDEALFRTGVKVGIRRRRNRRIIGACLCVIFIVGGLALQGKQVDDSMTVSASSMADAAPETPVMPVSKKNETAEGRPFDVSPEPAEFALEDDLFDDVNAFLDGSEHDWTILDESLGDEYIAFSQMIEITNLEESL